MRGGQAIEGLGGEIRREAAPQRWSRLHLQVRDTHLDLDEAQRVAVELRCLPGVATVTLNRPCWTLSIGYDGARVSAAELQRRWAPADASHERHTRRSRRVVDGLRWAPLLAQAGLALAAALA